MQYPELTDHYTGELEVSVAGLDPESEAAMSVTIVRSFKFNQKSIQNQGGWCAGISAYLIKKLHERGGSSVAPDEALKAAASACQVINCGFLAARLGYTTGSDVVVRDWIRQKQTQVDTALSKGTVFGNRYVYSHTDRGLALMTLHVSDTMRDRTHGGMFESWYDFVSSNGTMPACFSGQVGKSSFSIRTAEALSRTLTGAPWSKRLTMSWICSTTCTTG